MSSYTDLLRDPCWQRKRLEKLEEAGWTCIMCQSDSSELHVHHLMYEKGRKPWEYDNYHMVVLCDDCHKYIHKAQGFLSMGLIGACNAYGRQIRGTELTMALFEYGTQRRLSEDGAKP